MGGGGVENLSAITCLSVRDGLSEFYLDTRAGLNNIVVSYNILRFFKVGR